MSLIDLLSDGEVHSGEQLGRALGISRAAVWKQIEALRRKGLSVEVVAGRGYRLGCALEPWDEDMLRDCMSPQALALLGSLEIRGTTGSTSDDASARLRQGVAGAVVCLAEEQTAGRGRRGREWFSPWGRSFYGSIGWVFAEGLPALEGLSLAVGVALVRALGRYGIEGVTLKWPNDIEVGGAKLGGILIEVQAEAGGLCQAIIGIGLNLSLPSEASVLLGRRITDVAALAGGRVERNRLGALLIEEVLLLLRDYPHQRFAGVRDEWLRLDAMRNLPVEVTGLQERILGVGRGVDERGALLVETDTGLVTVQAGEVSLRGMN
jgi:BirA family biotin operon repressor/biotin-[acetyl-CoA-carboxylase] ligase